MAEEMITATIVIPADQLMALLKRQVPEDRHEQMVRLYGEACRQCKAAKILGVSAQTIMRMRDDGRLRATADGNLIDVLSGEKPGRENDDEFIYFDAVGLAYTDVSIAYAMYQKAVAAGKGQFNYLQEKMIFQKDLTGKVHF